MLGLVKLLFKLFGKGRPQEPQVPPQPYPAPVVMRVSPWLGGSFGKVTHAHLDLDFDGTEVPGVVEANGRVAFTLPEEVPFGWGAWLHLEAEGALDYDERVVLQQDLDVSLPPEVNLPRLQTRGGFFLTADGQRFTVIACTDFRLFFLYLLGEDAEVREVLGQRRALGFNTVRVLGMCHNMFRLYPQEHATYFHKLDNFCFLCEQEGLYVEFVAFADAGLVMSDPAQQQAYWDSVCVTLHDVPNVMLEAVNESGMHDNAPAFEPSRPVGVISCRGSKGAGDEVMLEPIWDYCTYHTNDTSEWQRKVGHNAMEIGDRYGVPCVANENTRFPDRCSDPGIAGDAAEAAALLCAGATFHSVSGKMSALFTPGPEFEAARAWTQGAQRVPLEFQSGYYVHETSMENSVILRAYSRRLHDAAYAVTIRK